MSEEENQNLTENHEPVEGDTGAALPEKHWYALHTYSGFENHVKANLEQRIITNGLEDEIERILVPTEPSVENKRGKTRTVNKKFFPGYILLYMRMTDETYLLVKNTPKVTGFVGYGHHPPPLSEEEVANILSQMESGVTKVKPTAEFRTGDKVKVNDGPFSGFTGEVDEVNAERSKLKVMVTIFGRQTPVELDFEQVEPAAQ